MAGQDNRRIALFHCNWVVQSQTANAILMLADAGYAVDLFLYNRPRSQDFVDLGDLCKKRNVQVFQLWKGDKATPDSAESPGATNGTPNVRRRLGSLVRTWFPPLAQARSFIKNSYQLYSLRRGLGEGLLPPGLVERALQIMGGKRYRCLIGVEKKGLIWAGLVARILRVPFFYYSLELYTNDGDYWRIVTGDRFTFECLRLGERLHHRNAAATIIQDPDRAQVLFDDTGVQYSANPVLYVPVSVLGGPHERRSQYLHESLAIPRYRKIILYFGSIWERRYVLELTQIAQRFPEDWVLVMHGEASEGIEEKIRKLDQRQKVIFSLKMVPVDKIQEVIASADVGLLFYSGDTHNERLTAFASEKMALYMQCGVPFVAFDYPGFRRLADNERCGMAIGRLEEMPEAIHEILLSYAAFREAAYRAFDKHYNYAWNFAKVIEAIDRLHTGTVGVKGNSR
jgi:glycosyltransferase involved in cell wall biosynthesis